MVERFLVDGFPHNALSVHLPHALSPRTIRTTRPSPLRSVSHASMTGDGAITADFVSADYVCECQAVQRVRGPSPRAVYDGPEHTLDERVGESDREKLAVAWHLCWLTHTEAPEAKRDAVNWSAQGGGGVEAFWTPLRPKSNRNPFSCYRDGCDTWLCTLPASWH